MNENPCGIPKDCLARGREYLLEDPTVERGCLITKSWEIIPFKNVSVQPGWSIEMGPEDFGTMADLAMQDKLYGWLHSHPGGPTRPSSVDLDFHAMAIWMIIYSVCWDDFCAYSSEEINQLWEYQQQIRKAKYGVECLHEEVRNLLKRKGTYPCVSQTTD